MGLYISEVGPTDVEIIKYQNKNVKYHFVLHSTHLYKERITTATDLNASLGREELVTIFAHDFC